MVLSFWHSGPTRGAACGKQLFAIDFALFFIFIGVELIYNIVLVAAVQTSESVIHTHISTLFRCFSHIGHYRVLSRVPCAMLYSRSLLLLALNGFSVP